MARRQAGGSLGDGRGGTVLASLRDRLEPARQAAPSRPEPATREDLSAAIARSRRVAPPPTERAKAAVAGRKVKKEIVRMSGADQEAALAGLRVSPPTAAATPAIHDFGEAAFRRLPTWRDRLDGFTATHGAPAVVGEATAALVARRVAAGARLSASMVDPDDGFFIGHDFGTSTTKTVLRHPYDSRQPAFALDVPPELASGGQPHLWPTVVFVQAGSGRFSLVPAPGDVALAGFKSALIEGRAHRLCGGTGVTMGEAATAFLALHLAYVLGALVERNPTARVAGVNMGVPVAALADGQARRTFERIVAAARPLIGQAATLTLEEVRVALILDDEPGIPVELHAELTGAIAGYCSARPRDAHGPHMILDCGSATFDIASFHLGDGRWPIGIHAASVERLGADACAAYMSGPASLSECRDASRYQEHRVFREALCRDGGGFALGDANLYPYQVVLIGGGMAGQVHGPLFDDMEKAFSRRFHRPALGTDLDRDDAVDPVRLIVADGLARDPVDLREVLMPRDRVAVRPSRSHEPVGKEQV